jgi:hypothetical protein
MVTRFAASTIHLGDPLVIIMRQERSLRDSSSSLRAAARHMLVAVGEVERRERGDACVHHAGEAAAAAAAALVPVADLLDHCPHSPAAWSRNGEPSGGATNIHPSGQLGVYQLPAGKRRCAHALVQPQRTRGERELP